MLSCSIFERKMLAFFSNSKVEIKIELKWSSTLQQMIYKQIKSYYELLQFKSDFFSLKKLIFSLKNIQNLINVEMKCWFWLVCFESFINIISNYLLLLVFILKIRRKFIIHSNIRWCQMLNYAIIFYHSSVQPFFLISLFNV